MTASIDVTYSRNYALVVTSIPWSVDWSENVDVELECDRNHGGLFLVFGLPIICCVVLSVVLGAICFREYKKAEDEHACAAEIA